MLLALSFAVLAGVSTACGAAPHGDGALRAESTIRAPGEARIGDRTTCLVSGEEFIVSATSPRTEYAGKTYYFCCGDCAKKFEAEPARFLKRTDGDGAARQGALSPSPL